MSAGQKILWWFDQTHPQGYLWLLAAGLIAALGLALASLWRNRPDETGRHDWGWAVLITTVLAAGRWPSFLVTRELNPDECQFLAGAHTLLQDPVYWRSVDGMSSGPLNYFALWPAGWMFGWDSYLPARLTAFVLLAGALGLAHQIMSLRLGRRVARLAGLGALGLEAVTNSVDFLHYSSELVPVALLTLAVYAFVRRWAAATGQAGWCALGGLCLGAIPLAKLQAVPLAGLLGLYWLSTECRPFRGAPAGAWRRRIYLVGGALLPAGLFACQLTVAGEWPNAIAPYYLYNVHYVARGARSLSQIAMAILAKSHEQDALLPLWLAGTALWLVLLVRPGRPIPTGVRSFGLAALTGVGVTLLCILQPGRDFLHYWQLLVVPLGFLLAAALAVVLPASGSGRPLDRWLVAVGALGLIGSLLLHRVNRPNAYVGSLVYLQQHPRSELAELTARFAQPGDALAIWGWSTYVYVEAGLPQGARDAHFERAVEPGKYRDYFRQRFLADLMHSQPALFLDSVGPTSLLYLDPRFRHDRNFPELATVIRSAYVQVGEHQGARLYLRRDRLEPAHAP